MVEYHIFFLLILSILSLGSVSQQHNQKNVLSIAGPQQVVGLKLWKQVCLINSQCLQFCCLLQQQFYLQLCCLLQQSFCLQFCCLLQQSFHLHLVPQNQVIQHHLCIRIILCVLCLLKGIFLNLVRLMQLLVIGYGFSSKNHLFFIHLYLKSHVKVFWSTY